MDFDEIVVKDSPGLCRCCLSEGCYKDLSTDYTWMGENEIYADMLFECFDISITQHTEGPNGSSRLICEVCITRLRDACNFKKQVLESEKKFVDMVGRGDFKPKVIVLDTTPLKTEPLPGPSEDDCEIEYLDEDADYTDGYRDDEPLQKLQAAGITVSSLSVKGKRGKKRSAESTKPVKAEKKKKAESKASKLKSSKDEIKLMETLWDSLAVKRRHNLQIIFNFTSIIPFKWAAKYMCFYCDKSFNEADRLALRKHTKYHGECFPDNYAIKQLVDSNKSVKVDVSQITCELCSTNFERLDEILVHVNTTHDLEYVANVNINLEPYSLNDLKCLMCYKNNNSFSQLEVHLKQCHPMEFAICSTCGQRFNSSSNLEVHVENYHTSGCYVCESCPQTFLSHEGLEYHKELLHDTICEICLHPFPTVKLKQRHIHAKHVTKFKCFACSKTFETKGSLRQHTAKCFTLKGTDIRIKVLEGEQEDMTKDVVKTMRYNMYNVLNMCTIIPFKWFMNRFRCFYCQLDFNDSQELREHSITKHTSCDLKDLKRCKGEQGEVKVDTSSLICKECSAVFDNLDVLIEHLISNHKLEYDKSAGTSFQEFKLHPKEMLCPFCNEKFSFFGNILKHINEKHFEKNFVCTYCGLFFCKEVNLRGHINSQHNVGLQCTMCPVKLQNKSKLIIHMANNHGEKISKCTMCSESFTSPYVRAKHMVEKHNLEYKCKYCTKVYPKNSFLQKHIKAVHPDKMDDYAIPSTSSMLDVKPVKEEPKTEDDFDLDLLSVLDCVTEGQEVQPDETPYVRKSNGEMSRRKRNLQLVLNMSTVLPFKWFLSSFRCFYCKRNFSDPELLKEHTLKTHFEYFELKKALKRYKGENVTVKVDVSSLSCRICSSHFDDINVLIDHLIMSHDADYDKSLTDCFMPFRLMEDNMICLVCGEKFTFFGHLLIHYNDQHLSKDHICSYCGLTFSKFVNLRAHISNRHSEDTHTCAECNSEFPSKSRLLTHMARNHGTKVSKCRHCDESFTTPYLRSKHMVEKHNLEHRCPHCHKVFPKNSTMKTHIRRVHLRERNVQCDVCSEKFFDNTLLRLHMVKHEGVRNFKCDYCGKTFLWMKNLRAHVKAHTKDLVAHNMSMAMC